MHHTHSTSKSYHSRASVSQTHDHRKHCTPVNASQSTRSPKALAIAIALVLATLLSLDPVNAHHPDETMSTDDASTLSAFLWEEDICEH